MLSRFALQKLLLLSKLLMVLCGAAGFCYGVLGSASARGPLATLASGATISGFASRLVDDPTAPADSNDEEPAEESPEGGSDTEDRDDDDAKEALLPLFFGLGDVTDRDETRRFLALSGRAYDTDLPGLERPPRH